MLNFKKVSAILSSAVMIGASMGMAAAANYPNPFVVGGTADVAIVYGTGAGVSSLDIIQAGNVQSNLQSYMGAGGTTGASVSGEAAELFTGGTKIYINDSLNSVKNVLTKSDLPTVLADQTFSGNVDASITQTINIGSNPRVTFAKQPTSSDDPNLALTTSTTQANYIYNATATFNKAVNMSNADSEGESISLFGQTFTIAAATDATSLVLLKSAEKISLSSDSPTADVTVDGKTYTVELISASDTAATIAVTDSTGKTESKEINEAASKKVNGVTIAVTTADETNLKLSASIVAGSDKFTLADGSSVTQGDDNKVIDGTLVDFGSSGTSTENMTALTISVYAGESDADAIKAGESFVDPVFGTFKLDFAGFNIASVPGETATARETILISPNGDDKLDVKFTEHRGNEATVTWVLNSSGSKTPQLMHDDDYRNITVFEKQIIKYQEYVVVGNEDEGYLLKLSNIKNQSADYSSDYCKFTDVFSGDTYETVFTSEGSGTISIGGKQYTVTMSGAHTIASEDYTVRLNYPDSTTTATAIIYPTIQTDKGAKIAFYEPVTINVSGWAGDTTDLTTLKIPDGDGYTDVTFQIPTVSNISIDAGVTNLTAAGESDTTQAGSQLTWNVTYAGADTVTIYLVEADGAGNINEPALIVFEEKDDNNAYEAWIVEPEEGGTSDDGLGVDSVESTWDNGGSSWSATRASDSKMTDKTDLYGTLVNLDGSDSDQTIATISYPDEQIYAQIYMGEEASSITAGTTSSGSTQLGDVLVKDTEVSSVSSKNLVIVGGSCINSAAAKVLGFTGATCGAAFTDKTGVGSGEFLIKGVSGAYTTGKLALVVAGYEAADTVNAAKFLTTQTVDTSKEYKGTSATSATLVTTSA